MVNPNTPPRENQGAWDNFGMSPVDDDFETPTGIVRKERAPQPNSPLSPVSLNMGKARTGSGPPRNSNKCAQGVDTEEEEEEEEEASARDEERPDARQLLHLSSGKPVFRGRFVAGDLIAENVKVKILARHPGTRVGTDRIMRATRDVKGGLTGALERAGDLVAMEALYEESGAEITIDHDQVRAGAQVVEATVGMCNNQDRSFHEKDSNLLTARVHRAARAAAPTSSAATPVYQKNANDGGCEQYVDTDGSHHCRPLGAYPGDMQEAAKQIDRRLDEAVARDCPEARVLVKHRFGNFNAREHTDEDGNPIVRRSVVARDMVGGRALEVLEGTSRHFCQGAHSGEAALSIAKTRLALNVEARRVLGESANYDDGDVVAAAVAMLRKLATGEHESREYRESLDEEKTVKLVAVADGLCGKSLEDAKPVVKDFGKLYGGRGYNAEDGRKGGEESHRKRKAKDPDQYSKDQAAAGAASSGGECNQVGAGPNLNNAAKLRRDIPNDMDDEEAGSSIKRERGMCLGLDAKGEGFAATLKASIDGITGRILPDVQLCSKPRFKKPGFLTLGRTRWQMDENGDLVLGYHNGNKTTDHPSCRVGGTVPAVEVDGEWVVPEWALWFISRGKVVLRDTNSKRHQ